MRNLVQSSEKVNALAILFAALVVLTACGSSCLLTKVAVTPEVISPRAGSPNAAAQIS